MVAWDHPANVRSDTRNTNGDTWSSTWIDLAAVAGITRKRYYQLGFHGNLLNSATYTVMCRAWQSWDFSR